MTTNTMLKLISMLLAGGLLPACGAAPDGGASSQSEARRQAQLTRMSLVDAAAAAHAYGQAHLGHFRDLRIAGLEKHGLELADVIRLRVRSSHTDYCIRAVNQALPSIHPWRAGTIGSGSAQPSPADRCRL